MPADARRLAGDALAAALRESRATTLRHALDDGDDPVPQRTGLNPVAWELGHLAWFAEFWILRGPHATGAAGFVDAARPPRIAGPDAIFDSARLAHADRWTAPLPGRAELAVTLAAQLDACLGALPRDPQDDAAHYFHRLALFHEDMHGEAFAWSRATLARPAPGGLETMPVLPGGPPLRSTETSSSSAARRRHRGFSFDNELPGRRCASRRSRSTRHR